MIRAKSPFTLSRGSNKPEIMSGGEVPNCLTLNPRLFYYPTTIALELKVQNEDLLVGILR